MLKDSSIESIIGIEGFATKQIPGMGGVIKLQPTDFIVREIISNGPIYDGSEIGEDLGGMYIHCVLWKSGLDTFSAIKKICNKLRIKEEDIGYAGLKDALAETYQRISIWNCDIDRITAIDLPQIKLYHPVKQKFAIKMGDLLGNSFEIIIRNVENEWDIRNWRNFKHHLESKGLWNFYGPQRFGSNRPILHFIGKLFLQEKYSDAIDLYLGETSPLEHESITQLRQRYREGRSFSNLRSNFPYSYSIERTLLGGLERHHPENRIILSLPKPFLRLAISAYQSFLFNKVLSFLIFDETPLDRDVVIPLPGYQSNQEKVDELIWNKLLETLNKERLDFKSFYHPHRDFRTKGSLRRAKMFPTSFKHYKMKDNDRTIKISFQLTKGSYATIVTRELIKKETLIS
ncbi:MAG: tRNA pseudouridine(13) synthase TruD [Candidatus Hermodarchaeota archaeon]